MTAIGPAQNTTIPNIAIPPAQIPVEPPIQEMPNSTSIAEALLSLQRTLPEFVRESMKISEQDRQTITLLNANTKGHKQKIINQANLAVVLMATPIMAGISLPTEKLFELMEEVIPPNAEQPVDLREQKIWSKISQVISTTIRNDFRRARNNIAEEDLNLMQKVCLNWQIFYRKACAAMFYLILAPGIYKTIDSSAKLLINNTISQIKDNHIEYTNDFKDLLRNFLANYHTVSNNDALTLDEKKNQIHVAFTNLLQDNVTLDNLINNFITAFREEFSVRGIFSTFFTELRNTETSNKTRIFLGFCLYPAQWIICSNFICNWLEKLIDVILIREVPLYNRQHTNNEWQQEALTEITLFDRTLFGARRRLTIDGTVDPYGLRKLLSYIIHPLKNIELLLEPQANQPNFKRDIIQQAFTALRPILEKETVLEDAKTWDIAENIEQFGIDWIQRFSDRVGSILIESEIDAINVNKLPPIANTALRYFNRMTNTGIGPIDTILTRIFHTAPRDNIKTKVSKLLNNVISIEYRRFTNIYNNPLSFAQLENILFSTGTNYLQALKLPADQLPDQMIGQYQEQIDSFKRNLKNLAVQVLDPYSATFIEGENPERLRTLEQKFLLEIRNIFIINNESDLNKFKESCVLLLGKDPINPEHLRTTKTYFAKFLDKYELLINDINLPSSTKNKFARLSANIVTIANLLEGNNADNIPDILEIIDNSLAFVGRQEPTVFERPNTLGLSMATGGIAMASCLSTFGLSLPFFLTAIPATGIAMGGTALLNNFSNRERNQNFTSYTPPESVRNVATVFANFMGRPQIQRLINRLPTSARQGAAAISQIGTTIQDTENQLRNRPKQLLLNLINSQIDRLEIPLSTRIVPGYTAASRVIEDIVLEAGEAAV